MLRKYWELFRSLFKIGLFTFGGGFAMLSLMETEFVENKKWLEHEEFMDLVVIAESTPGPIAINSATYIGFKYAGFFGSVFATLGVCIPSFLIIFLISLFFDRFMELTLVSAAFRGIQVCVVYLIFNAGYKMLKKMKKKPLPLILMSATVLAMITLSLLAVKFSTILYILIGAVIGIAAYLAALVKEVGK